MLINGSFVLVGCHKLIVGSDMLTFALFFGGLYTVGAQPINDMKMRNAKCPTLPRFLVNPLCKTDTERKSSGCFLLIEYMQDHNVGGTAQGAFTDDLI